MVIVLKKKFFRENAFFLNAYNFLTLEVYEAFDNLLDLLKKKLI